MAWADIFVQGSPASSLPENPLYQYLCPLVVGVKDEKIPLQATDIASSPFA